MRHVIYILAGWLAVTTLGWANEPARVPFHVGEKLTYQIYWGPFVAGRAILRVADIEAVDGHDCYHLVAEAHTTGLVDLLFHVESKTESWLDMDELFTRRFRQKRIEGKHTKSDDSHYDYAAKSIITTNFVTGRQKSAPLDGPVQDIVSCMYYVRAQPLQLDVDTKFPINLAGTRYDVTARPDERKSVYVRPLGDLPALRIEPTPTLNVVAANKGRMWFWVSDDAHKFLLLMNSDMKIGTAKFVLYQVEAGNPSFDKTQRVSASAP